MGSIAPEIVPVKVGAADSPWTPLHLFDFSGGMITDFPDAAIADNQFADLFNYYIDENKSLVTRPPFQPYFAASGEAVLPTVPERFFWANLNGADYLFVQQTNGTVARWSSGTWTSILSGQLSSSYRADFAKFSVNDRDDLIICNGPGGAGEVPLRWDSTGGVATDLGLAVPDVTGAAATDAAAPGARGITINGTYSYKLTYFYDSTTSTKYGESGPSAAFTNDGIVAGASTAAPKEMNLATLPDPSGITGVSKAFVYRSPGDTPNGPYLLVGYYTSGTTFLDVTPIGEEGVETPADAGTPPRLKYPVVANGRIWGVGLNSSGALGGKIVWSESGQPDMFFAFNAFYATGEIRGIAYFNKNIYVFTREAMWFLLDADPVNNEFLKIADRGCSSHHSIVDIGRGLVFQGVDNIYFFDHNTQNRDGDFPIPIADGLSNRIDKISAARQPNSAGALYNGLYIMSYTASGSTNNATIVWQTRTLPTVLSGQTAGWTRYSWAANHLQAFAGFLYTADATNKYIQEHGVSGVYDRYTRADYAASTDRKISTIIKSKLFHFDHPWTEEHFSSITAVGESSGVSMPVALQLNNGTYSRGTTLVLGTFVEPALNSLFGSATFQTGSPASGGDGVFATSNYGFKGDYARFKTGAKGRNAQLIITADNSADTKIIGLSLHHKTATLPI